MLKFNTMALKNPVMDIISRKIIKKILQSFKSDAVSVPQTLSLNFETFFKKLPMYRDPIY